MSGVLQVDTELDVGSRFGFVMPAHAPAGSVAGRSLPIDGRSFRLLVVDKRSTSLSSVCLAARRLSWIADGVQSIEEALSTLSAISPSHRYNGMVLDEALLTNCPADSNLLKSLYKSFLNPRC